MKLKKVTLILAVLCLLLFITGCADNAKSEKEICEEIEQFFLNDYSNYTFNDVTVSIDQRQTNADDKTDFVWASVYAKNDDLEFVGSYTATYVLYNDGWVLESCHLEDSDYVLLRPTVTEDQAKNAARDEFPATYDSLTCLTRYTNLDYNEDLFYFEGRYSDGYLTTADTIEVEYFYNSGTNKWALAHVYRISSSKIWDVLGKWEYNSGNDSMWLYVHEIGDGFVRVEYDFEYTLNEKGYQHYTSNGVETREYRVTFIGDGIVFSLLGDDDNQCRIFIYKTEGIIFEDNRPKSDVEYQLTYVGK